MASGGSVEVYVSSNINSFESKRRFPLTMTIEELKSKLEILTGASVESMVVQLLDANKAAINHALENKKDLNYYQVKNEMIFHVIDHSHQVGEFENVSSVEKYEISDDQYSKRKDTFRAFKSMNITSDSKTEGKKIEKELAEKISIGSRCEVRVAGQIERRGVVRYVGTTDFKPGYWVGVEFDEPLGKNDGSHQGKYYFTCKPKYGGFIKPQDVVIGDFPELCPEEI